MLFSKLVIQVLIICVVILKKAVISFSSVDDRIAELIRRSRMVSPPFLAGIVCSQLYLYHTGFYRRFILSTVQDKIKNLFLKAESTHSQNEAEQAILKAHELMASMVLRLFHWTR